MSENNGAGTSGTGGGDGKLEGQDSGAAAGAAGAAGAAAAAAAGVSGTANADGAAGAAGAGGSAAANGGSGGGTADGADHGGGAGTDPWGADWREKVAGQDAKVLERLKRYASPGAAVEALISAQDRIRAGELAKPLPKDATPEQVAEWRQQNGIPEKPELYLEKLPDGLVIGEDDKPLFAEFADVLHKHNVKPEVAHSVIGWYNEMLAKSDKERIDADGELKTQTEATLREKWGSDYKINVNIVNGFLSQAPQEIQDMLAEARLPDGTPIKGTAVFGEWLAALAREINPLVAIVPSGSADPLKSLNEEIAAIELDMKKNRAAYMKDEKKQERYRQLLTIRGQQTSRNTATG